jgi:hypothetical protein
LVSEKGKTTAPALKEFFERKRIARAIRRRYHGRACQEVDSTSRFWDGEA